MKVSYMIPLQVPFIVVEPEDDEERQELFELAEVYEEGYNFEQDALILPIYKETMSTDSQHKGRSDQIEEMKFSEYLTN